MNAYVLSYDLRQPGRNYAGLFSAIKSAPRWAHVLESTWVIWSPKSAEHILGVLTPHIDANDGLVVLRLASPAEGWWAGLASDVSDELRNNL